MPDGARLRVQHYREMAAHLRSLADLEPLASLRQQLRLLAAQHDEVAMELETPQTASSLGTQQASRLSQVAASPSYS